MECKTCGGVMRVSDKPQGMLRLYGVFCPYCAAKPDTFDFLIYVLFSVAAAVLVGVGIYLVK